ncbi:MAG: hypothetical protein ABL925_01120 [Methylococcales bacterium]
MKKTLLFALLILISVTANATLVNENKGSMQVKISYPSNRTLINTNINHFTNSDFSNSSLHSKQPTEGPSALALIGFALLLGFLGFRLKNSAE